MNENSENIFKKNNEKYQVKLDKIWLKVDDKQQSIDNKIDINSLNLCSFCNKNLVHYLNSKKLTSNKKSTVNNNKLLRSDSDSSMHLCRKNLFDRMAKERRSLRFKKNTKNNCIK